MNHAHMDIPDNLVPLFGDKMTSEAPTKETPTDFGGGNGGGGMLDKLEKRVDTIEKDTHQIKLDLAVLTTRSENFATKADIESIRTEHMTLRAEVVKELTASEKRTDVKFDAVNKRLDSISDRLLWTLMVPAIVALLLWFVKEAVLK